MTAAATHNPLADVPRDLRGLSIDRITSYREWRRMLTPRMGRRAAAAEARRHLKALASHDRSKCATASSSANPSGAAPRKESRA